VPAKVTGNASHRLPRTRQIELARRMIDDLHELLSLRGHTVSAITDGDARGFELEHEGGVTRIVFMPTVSDEAAQGGEAEVIVLALEARGGDPPEGTAVLDLLARRVHGKGGVVLDSVREFCRKRGIRFEPGPWRYRGGLV